MPLFFASLFWSGPIYSLDISAFSFEESDDVSLTDEEKTMHDFEVELLQNKFEDEEIPGCLNDDELQSTSLVFSSTGFTDF